MVHRMGKNVLVFEVSRIHKIAQGVLMENRSGSTPELGWPTHPSVRDIFQVLELKVPHHRKLLSPGQFRTHRVGSKK